jgi:hypothetical protein
LVPLQSRLGTLSSITHSFPWLSSPRGYVTYVVLPRSPLSPLRVLARLACLIHAANVHSEPGSNPFGIVFITATPRHHVPAESCCHRMPTFRACLPTHAKDIPQNQKHSFEHLHLHKLPSRFGSRTPSTRFNTTKLISQNHPTKLSKSIAKVSRRPKRGGIVTTSLVMSTQ